MSTPRGKIYKITGAAQGGIPNSPIPPGATGEIWVGNPNETSPIYCMEDVSNIDDASEVLFTETNDPTLHRVIATNVHRAS